MFLLFQILNPFRGKKDVFKNYYVFYKRLSLNKSFEFQISSYNMYLFEIQFDFRLTGKDHAGVSFNLTLFGYDISLMIYDNRHWDYEKGKWCAYEL